MNQWIARAHDLLSGENKQSNDVEDLKKLLHDAKSVKNLLEDTDHIQAIVDEIYEWIATYKSMIASSTESGAVRIEAFESLLRRSNHFPVRIDRSSGFKDAVRRSGSPGNAHTEIISRILAVPNI